MQRKPRVKRRKEARQREATPSLVPAPRPSIVLAHLGLAVVSGLAALLYQIVWTRELRLTFGASTAASAAVLAVFTCGTAVGAAWLGRRIDATGRALRSFGRLELGVALGAAFSPALLSLTRWSYAAVAPDLEYGGLASTALRLLASGIVLVVPTFFMGGTFPAFASAMASLGGNRRRRIALAYGANAFGAVLGVLLATFVTLEAFGNRGTLWLGVLCNVAVGTIALLGASRLQVDAAPAVRPPALPPPCGAPGLNAVSAAAFLSGAVFFAMEVVWYRLLAPLLGGTTYTFGVILATALFGLTLGGLAHGAWRRAPSLGALSVSFALEGLALAMPLALGDLIAVWALDLRALRAEGTWGLFAGWLVICAVVVMPAALVAGWQFPLLVDLVRASRGGAAEHQHLHVAADAGHATAANTLGSVVGSLAAGFVLLPIVGAVNIWRGAALALAASGAVLAWRQGRAAPRRLVAAVGVLACVCLATPGPSAGWRHSGIGAGGLDDFIGRGRDALIRLRREIGSSLLWEADGRESSVALVRQDGTAFIINGKVDGNVIFDAATQIMGGLLPAMVHPQPKATAVIGLGTGETAGWLAAVPGMERVTVVEIEPAIRRVAAFAAIANHDVLRHPKVQYIDGDARERLLVDRTMYDVIMSEPSNPYRAGIANLFTRDYYQEIRARLAPGGFFGQWVQIYDMDREGLGIVLRTMRKVFPHVHVWAMNDKDLILLGRDIPIVYDVEDMRRRAASPFFREALAIAWGVDTVEGLFAHFVAGDGWATAAVERGGAVATDDANALEFAFLRAVGSGRSVDHDVLRAEARESGFHRPPLSEPGNLEFDTVDALARLWRVDGVAPRPAPTGGLTPAIEREVAAIRRLRSGDLSAAEQVLAGGLVRQDRAVTIDVAGILARSGHLGALALRDRIAAASAIDARSLDFAVAPVSRGDELPRFGSLVETYRQTPWPHPELQWAAIRRAVELTRQQPTLVAPIRALLSEPFAVHANELIRLAAIRELTRIGGMDESCLEHLSLYGPGGSHGDWTEDFLAFRHQCLAKWRKAESAAALADLQALRAAPP